MDQPIANDPTLSQFRNRIGDLNKQIGKINEEMMVYEKKIQGQPEKEQEIRDLKETPPVAFWGDQRMNPLFLKVADFFSVDSREYPRAESKLTVILDWASTVTKSKKSSDILRKIAETSKALSVSYGERPYNVLYRYVRLAAQKEDIQNEMSAYKK